MKEHRRHVPRILVPLTWLLAWALLPLHAAAATFAAEDAAVARALDLMDERLALMPAVAAWKWQNGGKIRDPSRERAVVDGALSQAAVLGLQQGATRQLFERQIALAGEVQEQLHARWRQSGFDSANPLQNLDAEIRPRLDWLTGELLRAVYLAAAALERADFVRAYALVADQRLRAAGWSEESRRAALGALALVRLEPTPALDRVRAAGVLRVGTTGDYAPFSHESAGKLAGADIDLAQSLARQLGTELVFVRTSWPTLVEDLRRNKFDLALSGISITPQRQAVAAFSTPYFSGGKTIIARCGDVQRYGSVSALDRRSVRVIVNPGGTNEQYVREHVRHASILVHPDNRTIFEEIRAGRADVMITDDIEVEMQTRRHSDLCRAMQGTLTRADKAILMPQDPRWVATVNGWLDAQIKAGYPARLLSPASAAALP